MDVGILTGGGDTASLHAVMYGAAQKLGKLIGFENGWLGVRKKKYVQLEAKDIDPHLAGTMLGSSRENLNSPEAIATAVKNLESTVDSLIVIGGDDTITVGRRIQQSTNMPINFVTKSIDNDIGKNMPEYQIYYEKIINYFTSGFATAAFKAAAYTKELVSTSISHNRIMLLEVMGRIPGWLALSSYAGDPDFILVPEVELDFEHFIGKLDSGYKEKGYAIVVVAEGVKYKGSDVPIAQDATTVDSFGHKKLGGVAEILANRIKKELGVTNCNYVSPSYLYRSGILKDGKSSPVAIDEETAIYLGKAAAMSVMDGQSGRLTVLQKMDNDFAARTIPIEYAVNFDVKGVIIPRKLDLAFYDTSNYSITDEGREYFRPIMGK